MFDSDNDNNKGRIEVDEVAAKGMWKLLTESEGFSTEMPSLSFTTPVEMKISLDEIMPEADDRLTIEEQEANDFDAKATMLYGAIMFDGTAEGNDSRIEGRYMGNYEFAVYHAGFTPAYDENEQLVCIYNKVHFFIDDGDFAYDAEANSAEQYGMCICTVTEFLEEPGDRDGYMDCVLEGAGTVFYTNILEALIQLRMTEEFN